MEDLHLLPDEELVSLFKKGDNFAFDILTHRYENEIYSYLLFILRNKYEAEDILQNTFLKIMKSIREDRYHENGKFKPWIQRIAHNAVIDYFRCEKLERRMFIEIPDYELLDYTVLTEETTEDKIIYQQICKNVKKMIRFLPYNQQEIIVLRYYKGLSFKEIADYNGISINTALGRMRYAIHNMRKMVREHTSILSIY